jgi:hypothetical protein
VFFNHLVVLLLGPPAISSATRRLTTSSSSSRVAMVLARSKTTRKQEQRWIGALPWSISNSSVHNQLQDRQTLVNVVRQPEAVDQVLIHSHTRVKGHTVIRTSVQVWGVQFQRLLQRQQWRPTLIWLFSVVVVNQSTMCQ